MSTTIKKEMSGSATIKTTTREYHNLKGVPGSIIIIMSTTEYNKVVLLGIIIIKTTAREHSNKQKSQANTKIKRTVKTNTTREYHNQNDCSGVLQAKVLQGVSKTKGLPESI